MADFLIDYDDFSAGMFVGPNSAHQPKNTFIGEGMLTVEKDGMMMPCPPWVPRAGAGAGAISDISGYMQVSNNGGLLYMGQHSGNVLRSETTAGSSPDLWDTAGTLTNTFGVGFFRGRWCQYGNSIYVAEASARLAATQVFTNAGSEIVIPTAGFTDLLMYGDFMVGAHTDRIFWSAPTDPTTWPSSNFLILTDVAQPILSMCVHGGSLIVFTSGAIFQITGVLGSNESKIQLTTEGVDGLLVGAVFGAETTSDGFVLFGGRYYDGSAAVALRGSVLDPVAWAPSFGGVRYLVQCGATVAFYDPAFDAVFHPSRQGSVLVRSPNGRWHALPGAAMDAIGGAQSYMQAWAGGPPGHPYLYGAMGHTTSVFLARYRLGVSDPPTNAAGTAFTSATAQLAEYRRTDRIRVKEVICELALGTTTLNATRSIGLQILTPQTPLEGGVSATTYSSAGSTLQTVTLPALASTADQRVTVRFKPLDGTESFSIIPKVILQGVKLRRLLVKCSDVPERG